jgi:hypothetical protein
VNQPGGETSPPGGKVAPFFMTAYAILGSIVGSIILAWLVTILLRPSERPRSLQGLGLLYSAAVLTIVLMVRLWG